MRGRAGALATGVAALAVVLAGCLPVPPPPPPPPTFFTAISPPAGSSSPGTSEWYWAPAPGGHAVTLGVYRPTVAAQTPPVTLLLLNGGDGFRTFQEDLAKRFAASGFIAVVGCWFAHDAANRGPGTIDCIDGPTWKGMNATSVADVNALVAATEHVRDVDPTRLVLVGHSYGGGVAMLRAAMGHTEPVVSASGLLSQNGYIGTPRPTDQFPDVVAGSIHGPVLLAHGKYDPITPLVMAQSLAARLPSDNPATTVYYEWPASHGFPWQPDALTDMPGVPVSQRYVTDVTAWVSSLFSPASTPSGGSPVTSTSGEPPAPPPGPPPTSPDPTLDQL